MTDTIWTKARDLKEGDLFYVEFPNGLSLTEIAETVDVYDDMVYVSVAGFPVPYAFHATELFQVERNVYST